MKKIAVLTATRAEYGLLRNIISKLDSDNSLKINILVTGMHLSKSFGYTCKEIEEDGFSIDDRIPILQDNDSSEGVNTAIGLAITQFGHYFANNKPDLLIVLGDRYETLAVCIAAMNELIPIAHLYGGETTEGAVDEAIRHSITKMSQLHFTSTELYRKRVIQLGESPDRVFNVGATGVENALSENLLSRYDLEDSIGFKLGEKYAVVTFHPVTLEKESAEEQFCQLLKALNKYDFKYIFTKANADAKGKTINKLIDEYVKSNSNVIAFESLGTVRYLSAVKWSSLVIGNSSSGIVEVPTFGVPTINIGDRQKGRVASDSVINCKPTCNDICRAIDLAMLSNFRKRIKNMDNPYGDGKSSDKIVNIIKKFLFNDSMDLKKKFYDIEF